MAAGLQGAARRGLTCRRGVEGTQALDLDRIAERVVEEHGPLLAGLALEAHLRLQQELGAGGFQARGHGLPVGQGERQAEVRHGDHHVADAAGARGGEGLAEMKRNLVAEKVEIDPGVGAAALGATEDVAIETAGAVEVANVKGKVKDALHGFGLWAAVL
jgi:hypothetical protein